MRVGPGSDGRRTRLLYRDRDFILYAASLVLVGLGAWVALPMAWARGAVGAALVYLLALFWRKHGVAFDSSCFGELGRGLMRYPKVLALRLFDDRGLVAQCLLGFGVALGVEAALREFGAADGWWLKPFPYLTAFAVLFGALTAYRTVVLVDHLRKAGHVRAVLEGSAWARELKGLSTWQHLVHAWVTGELATLAYFVPCLVFWRFTEPTWARELVLFGLGAVVVLASLRGLRTRETAGPVSKGFRFLVAFALPGSKAAQRDGGLTHGADHTSRFGFTLFHGHHHDAVPCALVGGPGVGLLEAFDNGLLYLPWLTSALVLCVTFGAYAVVDMQFHQYVAGAFPFVRSVLGFRVHHVAHHFFSLKPLSVNGQYDYDVGAGYRPDNVVTQWFLRSAEAHEGVAPEVRAHFLRVAAEEGCVATPDDLARASSRARGV